MSNTTGPLYESLYVVAEDVREDFENWLREFQRRSLQEPGIEDARGYETDPDDDRVFRFTIYFPISRD